MTASEFLSHSKKRVEAEMSAFFSEEAIRWNAEETANTREHFDTVADYCLRGGKKIRPILTLAFYEGLSGKNPENILRPALAFELFHNYTLIHDDIYDEDSERRFEPAIHTRYARAYREGHSERGDTPLFVDAATRF
jgi:geranylgeranyl diphosphate synthase type I